MRRPTLTGILLALPLLACAKASDEDCEKLADKTVELAMIEFDGDVSEVGKEVAEQMRPKMLAECKANRPAKAEVDCILEAKKRADIDGC